MPEGEPVVEEEPAVEEQPVAEEPVVEEAQAEEPAAIESESACGCGVACGEAPEPVVEETQVHEGPQKCLECVAAGGLCAACSTAMKTADETVDDGEAEAWVERTKGESEAAEQAQPEPESEPMVSEEPAAVPVPEPTPEAEEAEAEQMLADASNATGDEQAEPTEADRMRESGVRTSDVQVDGGGDPADMPMTDEEHEALVQGDSNNGPERADPGEAPFYPSKDLPWEEVVRADPDAPAVSVIEPESPYGARVVLVAGQKKQLPRLPFFGCDEVSTEDYAVILQEIAKEDS